MTLQLDTSGLVRAAPGTWFNCNGARHGALQFGTLSPFTQGYIEALFAGIEYPAAQDTAYLPKGFSDLAPETLARIIADERTYLTLPGFDMEGSTFIGQKAWVQRQAGWPVAPFGLVDEYRAALPPLTVQLGDDGMVRFA